MPAGGASTHTQTDTHAYTETQERGGIKLNAKGWCKVVLLNSQFYRLTTFSCPDSFIKCASVKVEVGAD